MVKQKTETALEKFRRFQEMKKTGQVVVKAGAQPPTPTRRKRKFRAPLLRAFKSKGKKKKVSVKRKAQRISGMIKLLDPRIKQPVRRIISPPERQLQRLIQKRQLREKLLNTNPRLVAQKFREDRQSHLIENALRNKELSFNSRLMLERLLRIQTKGHTDDNRQQRINRERDILSKSMDLTKSHYNINRSARIDFTKLADNDLSILHAPNIFKSDPIQNPSILKTREGARTILDIPDEYNILRPKKRLEF